MPLTTDDARHLLRRVGFAGTAAEVDHFAGRDTGDVVDEILATDPTRPNRPAFARRHPVWPGIVDLRWWWLDRMVDASWVNRDAATPSPLEEKLTLFWHSHFATGASKVEDLKAMYTQNDLLRTHGRGTFGDLLEAVCTDGALLSFLDNHLNSVEAPQENFARELMELYTIGPDEFTERDVIEMTRVWTGHGTVGWVGYWDQTYEFHAEHHDAGIKTLFGRQGSWSGPEVLELFVSGVRRDATARFLARKLWRFFVDDAPTDADLDGVVAGFGPSLDISGALRAILLGGRFWAPATRGALVRSPIEFAVDLLRRTGIRPEDSGIEWQMDGMGQALFGPPSVAGWGTHEAWLTTATVWGKARFVGQLRWNEDYHRQFEDILDEPSAAAAAARIARYFGIDDASDATLDALGELWRDYSRRDSWAAKHHVVFAGALCPEFQVA